jgi:hypothetical protein
VFVVGSYFLAQEVKVKRPQRKLARRDDAPEPAGEPDREVASV